MNARRDRIGYALVRTRHWIDKFEAAAIVYDSYGRPVDEIERQRALEAREDQRRDDDYVAREDE